MSQLYEKKKKKVLRFMHYICKTPLRNIAGVIKGVIFEDLI